MKRLIAGPRAVSEALRGSAGAVAVVYLARDDGDLRTVRAEAERGGIPWERRSTTALDTLAGGLRHQGVLAVTGQYPYRALEDLLEAARPCPLYVALDQVTDPQNFGAIVRSAVALGSDGIITLKDRACPVTAAVVRASAGATEAAQICRVTNLARTLAGFADDGLQVVGLAPDGDVPMRQLPATDAGRVLVIGSEGHGLRRLVRERCTVVASIPLAGPVASLNASVAAAIALYDSCQQRIKAMGASDD